MLPKQIVPLFNARHFTFLAFIIQIFMPSELLKLAIWVYFARLARTASVHPELQKDGIVVNSASVCQVSMGTNLLSYFGKL